MSNTTSIGVPPKRIQPVQMMGCGEIEFGKNVYFGFYPCPAYWSTYAYLEVRTPASKIKFGDNIICNNGVSIISDGATISIGNNTLIGLNCQIYDADFHGIDPRKRKALDYERKDVYIGENVWLGNNVIILKGVKIGNNSIIAAGAVVQTDIPENCIAGGIPARILKYIGCASE